MRRLRKRQKRRDTALMARWRKVPIGSVVLVVGDRAAIGGKRGLLATEPFLMGGLPVVKVMVGGFTEPGTYPLERVRLA